MNSLLNLRYNNEFLNIKLFNNFFKLICNLNCLNLNTIIILNFINSFILIYLNAFKFKLNIIFLFIFCGFSYSKIFLKVGLGFRKKYSLTTNLYNLFVGRRKWSTFNLQPNSFFFNIRRRNIFLFCSSKKKLYEIIIKIKYMRKETVFKVKGIMTLNRIVFNRKISRSIIFARRVKFRKFKLKLTKKQKQRK